MTSKKRFAPAGRSKERLGRSPAPRPRPSKGPMFFDKDGRLVLPNLVRDEIGDGEGSGGSYE
jgi:hypothetical protein